MVCNIVFLQNNMTNYECYKTTQSKKRKLTWCILACHRFVFFDCFCDFEWFANSKVCNFQMPRIIPENISVILLIYNEETLNSFNHPKLDEWCTLLIIHDISYAWRIFKSIRWGKREKTYEGSRSRCIMGSGLCSCK